MIALEDDARIRARAFADMDRDVSDLKVQDGKQKKMLQAVGYTLSDHTMRLTRLEEKVDGLHTEMTQVKSKLSTVHAGVDTIIDMLNKAS